MFVGEVLAPLKVFNLKKAAARAFASRYLLGYNKQFILTRIQIYKTMLLQALVGAGGIRRDSRGWGGGTSLQEANGNVRLDEVAFS